MAFKQNQANEWEEGTVSLNICPKFQKLFNSFKNTHL